MASSKTDADDKEFTESKESVQDPEWILARQGINLLINNKHAESESLFLQYPNSLVMYAGYTFTVFMDALMSFEEEKLAKAILVLKEVEKRCTAQNGWFKSFSQRMFGLSTENSTQPSLAEQLETQIILADSHVCLAIITFLQQDLSGYFKGGWVLRKAWKVYQRTYKDILTLYKETIGELLLPDPVTTPTSPSNADPEEDFLEPECTPSENKINGYIPSSTPTIPHSHSLNFNLHNSSSPAEPNIASISTNNNIKKSFWSLRKSISINDSLNLRQKHSLLGSARFNLTSLTLSNLSSSVRDIFPTSGSSSLQSRTVEKKTIVRLMGAVSFGYGLFQLGVSLLPPSLTKLISLLGFGTNRQNGIDCLMYARLGVDMRAPLARLALLWYHTIVRPFYAIDGVNVQAGVEAANALIKESEKEFAESALFLFFAGRANRLNSDISAALTAFQKANDNANHREIKMLCLHEIGWCYLIGLNYEQASDTFVYLKHTSRWSRPFYVYLAAICVGALPDAANYNIYEELQKISSSTKLGQLDEFLGRRFRCCPKSAEEAKLLEPVYFRLLVFEMLYLWNALASCNHSNVQKIVTECSAVHSSSDEPRIGLANLILGSCYTIQQNTEQAEACFRKCLEQRRNEACNAEDAHISAFAQYELGNILLHQQQTKEEGKCQLQQISKYNHYDFEARLNVRVHSILRHLD